MSTLERELVLTSELLRAYSRRGNFHSDAGEARALGMPGLVAQGMQVAGPAYGLLLDAWGEGFLAGGEVDLKFVGMVVDGQGVLAAVDVDNDEARFQVTNRATDQTAVIGRAARRAPGAATGR
jgi:acyl dehydratase